MKRILVITNNLKQASFRVRIAPLIEPLRRRGFELDVQVRPRRWMPRRALLRSSDRYDAVILQRKLLDGWDAGLLRRSAKRIFFDVDDAVMYHAHRVGLWSQWRTTRRFEATTRILDHVVVGNEYLADHFRQRGCRVTVLPTVVDPEHYIVKHHTDTNALRLVWIGSHSTLPYLREHLPHLEQAAKRVPGLRLLTIADVTVQSEVLPIDHASWSADAEAELLVRGDVGIAPTPSDRWTLGKCGFKIVQYMAAGLPVIASPVGANAEIVQEGITGHLPATPEQWPELIRDLATDTSRRAAFGAAGRQRVEEHFSLAHATEIWAALLA